MLNNDAAMYREMLRRNGRRVGKRRKNAKVKLRLAAGREDDESVAQAPAKRATPFPIQPGLLASLIRNGETNCPPRGMCDSVAFM